MNERPELSEAPDWLTDMDKEILEVLTTDLILTPSVIAENIGRSRKGVSNRLNALQAGGVVEKKKAEESTELVTKVKASGPTSRDADSEIGGTRLRNVS